MACVLVAAEQAGTPLHGIVLKEVVSGGFKRLERTDLTIDPAPGELSAESAASLRGADCVFSFVGGIFHSSLALRRHPQPFDFVLPEAPGLPLESGADVIPADAMREAMTRRLESHLRLIETIVLTARGPVYQFESPPPAAEGWITQRLTKREIRGDRDAPLAGRFLRYKLWRLNSSIFRDYAERAGARFVSRPQGAVDDEGFLRGEFCKNAVHANAAYGALLLEQMRSLQAEQPAPVL